MKARQKTDAEMRKLDRDSSFAPEPAPKGLDLFDAVILLGMIVGYIIFIAGTITLLAKLIPHK